MWEIQDHHVLVRASTLIIHILTDVSLPEEEVRVRERASERENPWRLFSVSVKGNGGWGLLAAREVHHLRAAAASGVSAVMQTRGKMFSSAEEEENVLLFLFFFWLVIWTTTSA